MFLAAPQSTLDRVSAPVSVRSRERSTADTRLTRYRGGTYSSTVETVTFTDGTTARTDLIRLNPNVTAYSLDFTAAAPTAPAPYRAQSWSTLPTVRARGVEAQIDWILRNSFPSVGTAELSRRLRDAGYSDTAANIAEHEAIAATQAAIWFFTNDLHLDNRPLNVPTRTTREAGVLTFEFDGAPQLGGYTVDASADAVVSLQKSIDGNNWQPVAGSALHLSGAGRHRKALGVGATTSHTHPGGRATGYCHYRLVVTEGSLDGAEIGFWLQGTSHYRNADRIVQLYDHLLAGARWAARRVPGPELSAASAVITGDRVGPFVLHADRPAALTVDRALLIDAQGTAVTNIEPGAQFWLQPHLGADTATVAAAVAGGRMVAGVAERDDDGGLTPVVLTRPMPMVVDFELGWNRRFRRAASR